MKGLVEWWPCLVSESVSVQLSWWVGARFSVDRWVGGSLVYGPVQDLLVGRWLLVSGRWSVGGRWFCNASNNSTMLTVQFHWQLETTSSRFSQVNILLIWYFIKKRNENDKNTNSMMKNKTNKKNAKKVYKSLK